MTRRPNLREIRRWLLAELDHEWRTPSELQQRLSLPGSEWYRVALILERLAADGQAELRVGGRVRRFRSAP